MSSQLRKCDATRQHTSTASRMTMFEPLAAARPAVGSSRSLCCRETTLKGAGRITQSQAWRARWDPRQTGASSGTNLQSKGKARATRSRAAATTKERKGNYVRCALRRRYRSRGAYAIFLGSGKEILHLRQQFRGEGLPLTARTNRAGSLRGSLVR